MIRTCIALLATARVYTAGNPFDSGTGPSELRAWCPFFRYTRQWRPSFTHLVLIIFKCKKTRGGWLAPAFRDAASNCCSRYSVRFGSGSWVFGAGFFCRCWPTFPYLASANSFRRFRSCSCDSCSSIPSDEGDLRYVHPTTLFFAAAYSIFVPLVLIHFKGMQRLVADGSHCFAWSWLLLASRQPVRFVFVS